MTVKGFLKWGLLLVGAGTVFGAMAVAILILRFDPPRVLVSVHNETALPILIARLTYGGKEFAKDLTLAPGDQSARFCTWPSRHDNLVLDFQRPGAMGTTSSVLPLNQRMYEKFLFFVEIHDEQVIIRKMYSEPYVLDSPCLFFR